MQLYFAVLPSEKIKEKVEEIREKYQEGRISVPHITLIPPFKLVGNIFDLINELEDVLKGSVSFETEVSGLDVFDKGENSVLFAKVVNGSNLRILQDKISTALVDKTSDEKENFTKLFHLTILKRMPFSMILRIKDEVNQDTFNGKFSTKEVILFGIKNNEPWQIIKRFKLKWAK